MLTMENVQFCPISMINAEGLQRVELRYSADRDAHLFLKVSSGEKDLVSRYPVAIQSGDRSSVLLLPPPEEDFLARWELTTEDRMVVAGEVLWKKPREWTIYVMVSSHTDIGLHNSQFIQRYNSENFLDKAMELCDQTEDRSEWDRYRYTMEGTWFWNNYGADRGNEAAQEVVEKYIKPGKIGVCAGVAGNHTQTYGLEEMCRSAYSRRWLLDRWGIDSRTMTMIDNNGLSWGLVQPYVDAGYENLFFSPNQWNPLPSTIWKCDTSIDGYVWNCDAGGGGSRIDIRYDSALPMVFYWENEGADRKILVCGSTQYGNGGKVFGLYSDRNPWYFSETEDKMAQQLTRMEKRYPYDMWLIAHYSDDQEPSLILTNQIERWNSHWKWPKLRTAGNLDEYFSRFREKFDGMIPTVRGEIAGGWYQHPVTAPELLAAKFEADRALPTAEKLATLAGLIDAEYQYPAEEFSRAWSGLVCNDEHSYGTSGYQGSRVFETWMQHRDWIEFAQRTAKKESTFALQTLAKHISAEEEGMVVFNPTLQTRREWIECDGKGSWISDIPPMGYRVISSGEMQEISAETLPQEDPPVVENEFYRVTFAETGGMRSIFDKKLRRELLRQDTSVAANTFLYTNDNHKTFFQPGQAQFSVTENAQGITVTAVMSEEISGANLVQTVILPAKEKQIRIENRLDHVRGLFNTNRYYRYAYYAFPFDLPGARRWCHLNGCVAEYGKDVTGHGTDVYLAGREWCAVEKDGFGIGWMQLDSQLVEFDRIHPDKTDYGNLGQGAELYSYIATDWLQMHTTGGSEMNFRFRYQITSYEGDFSSAGIPDMAERLANPVLTLPISRQTGDLPAKYSFFATTGKERLLTLKRPIDGNGLIARLYDNACGYSEDCAIRLLENEDCKVEPLSICETPLTTESSRKGFRTLRICPEKIHLSCREMAEATEKHPPIGSVYTGLIQEPRATCGEDADLMYLLWGQSMEADLTGYELYRGEYAEFEPADANFVALVDPGVYRVVRYEDRGLQQDHRYYYRVRAVYHDGNKGEFSDAFTGKTREKEWVEPCGGNKVDI